MKNHFDISGSIEISEVDIAGVACSQLKSHNKTVFRMSLNPSPSSPLELNFSDIL